MISSVVSSRHALDLLGWQRALSGAALGSSALAWEMVQLCDPAHVGAVPSLVRYGDDPEHKRPHDMHSESLIKTDSRPEPELVHAK